MEGKDTIMNYEWEWNVDEMSHIDITKVTKGMFKGIKHET